MGGTVAGVALPARLRAQLAIACLGLVIALGCAAGDVLRPLELASVDARFAVRGAEPSRVAKLLIVAIDAPTIDAFGHFPFKRRYYADAVRVLHQEGARQLVLDVQLTEETDEYDDDDLIEALGKAPGAVLVTTDTYGDGANDVLGGPSGQQAARVHVASADFPRDDDATFRRFDLRDGGLPSVAVRVAALLQPGFRTSELGRAPVLIDYAGGPRTVRTVSMAALVAGRVPASLVRGRVVVLGATDPTLQDLHNYSSLSDRPMPGPEIEANAIATALAHAPLRGAAGWLALLLTLLVALVPSTVIVCRVPVGAAILAGTLVAYLLLAQLLFDSGTVVPVANPALALVLAGAAALLVSFVLHTRAQAAEVFLARQRAVHAADEARRRVERDLHDGVQQRLVALAMGLSMPRREPPTTELLSDAVDQLRIALAELRELARGAFPAVLQEAGLEGALQSLADHAALPVTLETRDLDEIGGTAARTGYFVAAEGLANAAKHAGPATVRIVARRERDQLELTVADDGRGGANPESGGSGLSGLRERAAAAGGTLTVASRDGAGTTLTLRIPV